MGRGEQEAQPRRMELTLHMHAVMHAVLLGGGRFDGMKILVDLPAPDELELGISGPGDDRRAIYQCIGRYRGVVQYWFSRTIERGAVGPD